MEEIGQSPNMDVTFETAKPTVSHLALVTLEQAGRSSDVNRATRYKAKARYSKAEAKAMGSKAMAKTKALVCKAMAKNMASV